MQGTKRIAAYVNLDRIEANFRAMNENLSEGTRMMAVIKSDGYGHGAVPIASLMEPKAYIWGFATATAEEGLKLRAHGVKKPILVLGYTFPELYREMVEEDLRPTVFEWDMARELSEEAVRQGKTLRIHIKVDTGMSRIGFADTAESVEVIRKIRELPGLKLEGLFTHFARADEEDKTWRKGQLDRFQKFMETCRERGLVFPLYHCSNSAGILDFPEAHLGLVRAGIALYGLYPSEEMQDVPVKLMPAMELKSHIVQVKEIGPGTQVSYGGTYEADCVRRIATIPVGYGDGYPRSLSGKGVVLIAGKRAPIRGRVCMDQFMVDVTDIPEAETGMEVTLFGEGLPLEELCEWSGRFHYEFVCCITKRVPRVYLRDGRAVQPEEIRGF